MKSLVTGATGFIGTAVVRALIHAGRDVRVLARKTSDLSNLQGLPFETMYGDLRDIPSLHEALQGCQHLYHVGAHYALWAQDPSIFYEVNVTGTCNLLEAAKAIGIDRTVYTSTIGAIGLHADGRPSTEETLASLDQMSGHYKRSKFLAEQAVTRFADAGFPVVIVNPSAPIGERDIKPTPTGQMIVDFMKGKMWAYIETGMNLVDVEDVAIGHIRAMDKGRIGERYILGHQNMSLREIFEQLSRITGIAAPRTKLPWQAILPLAHVNHWISDFVTHRPPRIPLEGVRMAKYRMHYDCGKALRDLDLPQTPIETALRKAVRWFQDHHYV